MLEERFRFLKEVKGGVLDDLLEQGWYRQGFVIFTSHFVPLFGPERKYRVHWLRYVVPLVQLSRKQACPAPANNHFSVSCHPFRLTDEVDNLHKVYARSVVKFQASGELSNILIDINNDIYDSHVIEIRDDGKLIACGVFDKGRNSIAGIINFYDPAYKKYSPGKWLMIEKYKYCLANNIGYYYPGYFTTEHTVFDYKLSLDKKATEVFLPETGEWIPYQQFAAVNISETILPHV